jgi:hypothetical protein
MNIIWDDKYFLVYKDFTLVRKEGYVHIFELMLYHIDMDKWDEYVVNKFGYCRRASDSITEQGIGLPFKPEHISSSCKDILDRMSDGAKLCIEISKEDFDYLISKIHKYSKVHDIIGTSSEDIPKFIELVARIHRRYTSFKKITLNK